MSTYSNTTTTAPQAQTQETIKFYFNGRHVADWHRCQDCGGVITHGERHVCRPEQDDFFGIGYWSVIPFDGEPCYYGDPDADDYGLEGR